MRISMHVYSLALVILSVLGLAHANAAEEQVEYPRITTAIAPDLTWVPRTVLSQPSFASAKVRWCLIVLGNARTSVLTLAWDESAGTGTGYDTLWVDTNLDGRLAGDQERFFWSNDPAQRTTEKDHHECYLVDNIHERDSDRVYSFRFAGVYKPDQIEYDSGFKVVSPGLSYDVGLLPGELTLKWSEQLSTAPIYYFGGQPIPQVNGKPVGESLGTWKAGANVAASVYLALHGSPADAEFRFFGSKFPSLADAVRDNRWGKAGYPIVLLRVLDPVTRQLKEVIPFGDSCPCSGGFAPQMILPSRVPTGAHEVVVRMLRVAELGGCADFIWPVTVENPFEKNPVIDPAFAALKAQFPDAIIATLRRADSAAEHATLRDGEKIIPTAVSDTKLLPSNRDWDARHANFGGDSQIYVGQAPWQHADLRSLLRFDLSGVPKDTIILGARLRLTLVVAGEGALPVKSLYGPDDVLEAFALRRTWNERQDHPDGYACWFGPRYRGELRESWAQEGAAGLDTDRDAKPAGTTIAMRGYPNAATGELVRYIDLDLTEVVKNWHSGSRPNFGVLLQMRGTGGGSIASSEEGDYPFRPALVIAYRGVDPLPTYTPRPGEDVIAALSRAAQEKRPLVLRFSMEKCAICARVEATTFHDSRVVKAMGEVLGVMVDINRHPDLAERLGVDAAPALVVLAPDGKTVIGRAVGEALARAESLLPTLALAFPARPRAPLLNTISTIVVDGALDDGAWITAGKVGPLVREDGTGPSVVDTQVRVLARDDALYLSAICPESKADGMVAKATVDDDDQVWKDDCFEIFIEPRKGSGEELHFVVSAGGHHFDSRNGDKAWNGDWASQVRRKDAVGWTVEIRIPWTTLGLPSSPTSGGEIGFNVGRTRNADGEGSQWSLTGSGGSHQPTRFGTLVVP